VDTDGGGGSRLGKEVTVVVELKARFDEEAISTAEAGKQGRRADSELWAVGLKKHAKLRLLLRREFGAAGREHAMVR